MADEIPVQSPTANAQSPAPESAPAAKLTAAAEKKIAIQAYHDAKTREERAALVKQYPVLAGIYSEINHN